MKPLPTQKRLKELFQYDPETGIFTSANKRGKWPAGRKMGTINTSGYISFRVDDEMFLAHRLAWVYMTGLPPSKNIDHINRVKSDNRFCNLREATQSENTQNVSKYSTNKSGFPGVQFHKRDKRWVANISHKNKQTHLGYFESAEAAYEAYSEAKARLHPFSQYGQGNK